MRSRRERGKLRALDANFKSARPFFAADGALATPPPRNRDVTIRPLKPLAPRIERRHTFFPLIRILGQDARHNFCALPVALRDAHPYEERQRIVEQRSKVVPRQREARGGIRNFNRNANRELQVSKLVDRRSKTRAEEMAQDASQRARTRQRRITAVHWIYAAHAKLEDELHFRGNNKERSLVLLLR